MTRQSTRLCCIVFGDEFRHMWMALNRSVRKNYKSSNLFTGFVQEPQYEKWLPNHCVQNLYKFKFWNEFIKGSPDGSRIVFLDADILILRDLDKAFGDGGGDWDVAYTVRESRVPFNSGVVYVNVNARSREFFDRWQRENQTLYDLKGQALPILMEFAGLNQRAFKVCKDMAEAGKIDVRMHALPCEIWNCEQDSYAKFSEETAVLHVKSELRAYLLNDYPQEKTPPAAIKLVELCRKYGY